MPFNLKRAVSAFKKVNGFLSKDYMKSQDEYDKELSSFFRHVTNHEGVFEAEPKGKLTIYTDEWNKPDVVYGTFDEFDVDDEDDMCVCNWTTDDGIELYTMVYSNGDEIRSVTRAYPVEGILDINPRIIDDHWHVVRLEIDNGERWMYVWESYDMDALQFMEMYTTWVKRYGEWEPPSDLEEDSEAEEDSDADSDEDEEGEDADEEAENDDDDVSSQSSDE
jgi:hypothetical protein